MFSERCNTNHQQIVAGKCPWCGLTVLHGKYTLDVRSRALNVVGRPQDEWAIPVLVEALRDGHVAVRLSAADTLGRFHTAQHLFIKPLLELLEDEDPSVRYSVIQTLLATGNSEAVRHAFFSALRLREEGLLRIAMYKLSEIGRNAKPAVQGLVEVLKGREYSYQLQIVAAEVLGQIGSDAEASLPVLRQAVDNDHALLRVVAAEAIWRIGGQVSEALRRLSESVQHSDVIVRAYAAFARWRIDRNSGAAISVFLPALNHTSPSVRAQAAFFLGEMGKWAASVVPQLRHAATRKHARLVGDRALEERRASNAAAEALDKIISDQRRSVEE